MYPKIKFSTDLWSVGSHSQGFQRGLLLDHFRKRCFRCFHRGCSVC